MTGSSATPIGVHLSGRFAELEDALVERVLELKAPGPLAPLTVVVGSSALRTRVGDLLVRRTRAWANISVLTLSRLTADLTAGVAPAPVTLSAPVLERVVQRVVAEHAGALRHFLGVRTQPHFARALLATLADLREAGLSAGPALTAALSSAGAPAGAARLSDLDLLYTAFCAALDDHGLADPAAAFLAAERAVRAVAAPGKAILYGIYDVNEVQRRLVAALVAAGADVFEPLPQGASRPSDALSGVAAAAGLVERRLPAPAPSTDRGRLAAVWQPRGAGASPPLALAGDGSLTVVSVGDERAEAREAVRTVLSAAHAGVPLYDCAVVVPHADDAERVTAALRAAGLPVAATGPERSAGVRVLVRLADCLAPPAGAPFSRRAVVDLLSAAPLRRALSAPGASGLWLDEARRAGVIDGLEQWTVRLRRRRQGLAERVARLQAQHAGAPGEDEAAELAEARLRSATAADLEAAVADLARACARLPERASWTTWAGALERVAADLFAAPVAAAAHEAAARLAALDVVPEDVGLADTAGTVRELLAGARTSCGSVGRDGVAVLTPLQMRGLSFDTVVFTGLAAGGFPARGRPDPLLTDTDRRRLADALGVRLPLAEQRAADELLVFALVCEAARTRLWLLVPRTDSATGRPRLPSPLLLRLAALAADRPVGLDEFLTGRPLAPVWSSRSGWLPVNDDATVWVDARERDQAVLLDLARQGGPGLARGYLTAVLGDEAAAARRVAAWRATRDPEPGPWDGMLGPRARAAIAARHPFAAEVQATRLERYVECPFSFLLRDVLGLRPPDEPGDALDIDPRELGDLAHDILRRAYQTVIADAPGLDAVLAALATAWRDGCADAERRGVTGASLAWEVRRELLRDDLLEAVRRDPAFHQDGRQPVALEWGFGDAAGRPVELELDDGRRLRFAGRLDRLDETAQGACVIDYKTGSGTTEADRLKAGLSVQLPVYQLAVRQHLGVARAGVSAAYRSVTRSGAFAELPLGLDEPAAADRLRELVTRALELIDAGAFPRASLGHCDFCDAGYACGATSWSRERKRSHPSLAGVRALQSGVFEDGDDDA